MTNEPDQHEPLTSQPADRENPEDVVRRLLEAEAGESKARPKDPPRVSARQAASEKAAEKQAPVQSFLSRVTAAPRCWARERFERMRAAISSYRPTPRHMAVLILIVIALTLPWLIPILILLGLGIMTISYLTIGHDRSGELVAARYGWLAERNPEGAEKIRSRAASISARLTVWAGYLPDSWTTGLYLPEFDDPKDTPDVLSGDPFDRLSRDTQNQ